ncbi:fap1 adhesin [Drosophila virilis]|uniref:fap1 adhesin n=1 Tax=Drosophila virilis TaxID=7244 RepID=UPI001395FD5D|nr:uncharacterized protein LOC6631718 [Drosophila virilis]
MSSSSEEKRLTQSTALGEKTTENEQENVGGVDDLTECKSEDDYEDDVHDVVDDDDDDDDIADGIAEDFIEYVMEYVGDDLIDGFIEKLTNGRTKEEIDVRTADKSEDYIQECKADELIKNVLESTNIDMIEKETEQLTGMSDDLTTESAGDDDDDDDDTIRENKTEHSVIYLIEYITAFVAEDIILSATDKVTQFASGELTERLIKCITEYVADDIIESVVNVKRSAIIETKTEQITDFIMGFISDNEILHTILNLSGLKMMRKTKDLSGALTGRPIDYLTNEFIQKHAKGKTGKKSRDLIEPLAEQLTENLANSIINAILCKLNRDTAEHLTDYVTEYVTEDLLEELCEELSDDTSKCSVRTYTTYSSNDATVRNCDSDSEGTSPKTSSTAASDTWKNFTDEEYENGFADCTVNQRSFFTFVHVQKKPNYIVNVPKRPTLEQLIREMVNENLGASMRIKIGDRPFDCIPNLLKVNSPWFANRDWHEEHFQFREEDVPILAFELIYKWLRFQTPIALSDAIKVLQASRHLQIDLLESDCWDLLSQKHVREKVAFRLFLEAEKMPALEDVREIMLSRVRGYFLALVGSEDFLNLKLDQLLSLLKRDSIGVNCEVEVFFAAVRWLSKSKNRLEHMQTVMRCVRFAYMPMPMLFRIRAMGLADENQPIGSTERVLQEFQRHPEMPQMLYDAMTYISLHFQNEMEPDPIDPDDEIQQKLVYPRRWIYHPKCPYHKARLVYPYQHSLTQQEFDNYVCMIQKDWMGEEPPVDAVLDVEFDGVVKLSPKLSSETLAR